MKTSRKMGRRANLLLLSVATALAAFAGPEVLPGYLTDPSMMKGLLESEDYTPPESLQMPYFSTYYVKPTVTTEEEVKVGFYVTDFFQSEVRFLDKSHVFAAVLEYAREGEKPTRLRPFKVSAGDGEFRLGKLPAGDYWMRAWAVDRARRESHRVYHKFRVIAPGALDVTAAQTYRMTDADLAAYGIRNDGNHAREVRVDVGAAPEKENPKDRAKRYVAAMDAAVAARDVRRKGGVPGYTVFKPVQDGKFVWHAYEYARLVYDEGYDTNAVYQASVATAEGLQKLLDEKAAAGVRKFVMLPGVYRIAHDRKIVLPDNFTLDLNGATLKQNPFTGCHSVIVSIASGYDSHLVGGTLEGDYWEHDYKNSPNNSEWPMGFCISGGAEYSSVENVKVVDITGYGCGNGLGKDKRGDYAYFYCGLAKFAKGGLDAKTGLVNTNDAFRYTTDFTSLAKTKPHKLLQISRYLGYQARDTRSWTLTVCWYDAEKKFLSSETCWQYRVMRIPENAAFLRCSIEAQGDEEAKKCNLKVTHFRVPWNCAIRNCTVDHARCVGMAPSQMKNMLFEGNFVTHSGESAAKCAFDAEDGWDQMQDVYFLRNKFRDNPMNNSILTCCGHNFIFEKNDGGLSFWGRTHSPCVRDNDVTYLSACCDSRLRSGYGRFTNNRFTGKVGFGLAKSYPGWDFVLSGLTFDGKENAKFSFETGTSGRFVDCTFRNMSANLGNLFACRLENCNGAFMPKTTWFNVTATNCSFKNFYTKFRYNDCTFEGCELNNIGHDSDVVFSGCKFRNGSTTTFGEGRAQWKGCSFDGYRFQFGYWQKPAFFTFDGCDIKTPAKLPFLSLATYATGNMGFNKCKVTGVGSLMHLGDVRAQGTDNLPGTLWMSNCVYSAEAPFAVTTVPEREISRVSPKQLTLTEKGSKFAKGKAFFDKKLTPKSWTVR